MADKAIISLKEYVYECGLSRKSDQTFTTTYRRRNGTILASSPTNAITNLHTLAKGAWGGWTVTDSVIRESASNKKIVATSKKCTEEEKSSSATNSHNTYGVKWATPWHPPIYGSYRLKENKHG